MVFDCDETFPQDGNFFSPRLAGVTRLEPFTCKIEGCLGQVDRVPQEGRLPCLAWNASISFFSLSQGSCVRRVTRLARAPSLHVNRPKGGSNQFQDFQETLLLKGSLTLQHFIT